MTTISGLGQTRASTPPRSTDVDGSASAVSHNTVSNQAATTETPPEDDRFDPAAGTVQPGAAVSGAHNVNGGTSIGSMGSFAFEPAPLTLSPGVHQTSAMAFKPHTGGGRYGSYLTVNVPFAPVKDIFDQVDDKLQFDRFKTRGEAHITVITPVEYRKNLEAFISIDQINQLAMESDLQSMPFEVLGLGVGKKEMGGDIEETFFLVVDSPALREFRAKVHQQFVDSGGDPQNWDPEHFYPHITVGFTQRDLHESDGVIKDRSSLDPRFTMAMAPV